MSRRSLLAGFLVCAVSSFAPVTAQTADSYPSRPIRVVIANPPGGGMDVLTRAMQKRLQELLGQPIVIDYRAGAQGSVGVGAAIKSAPDGYTVAALPGDTMVINPFVFEKMSWSTLTDVVPVVRAITHPMVLTAHPSVPVRTLKELEAYLRANPGKLSYASSGAHPQVVGEYFKALTKTDMLHVRYNGAGAASLAAIAGTTDLMISSGAGANAHILSGKLRGIAVFGKERSDATPNVPTAAEAGYPELAELTQWYGYGVPVGTPPEIVKKLNAAFVQALQDPEVVRVMRAAGMTPAPSTPEEFGQVMKADYERYGKIVKQTGIKPE